MESTSGRAGRYGNDAESILSQESGVEEGRGGKHANKCNEDECRRKLLFSNFL